MTRARRRLRGPGAALLVAFSASLQAQERNTCPLEIEGVWKPVASTEAEPMLLSFGADGWASVLVGTGQSRAADFDIGAQVQYTLDSPREPKRIVFTARRGNDLFPPGESYWEIDAYSDTSLVTRKADSRSAEQDSWERVETHRYFLTFAARAGSAESDGPAFVMWTRFDGRKTELAGFGVHTSGGDDPTLGRIPEELAKTFTKESASASDVMLRIELNEAEYLVSRRVYEAWDMLVGTGLLAEDDPYRHSMEFLEAVVYAVNRCRVKIALNDDDLTALNRDDDHDFSHRDPLEFIRLLRARNNRSHVKDRAFPSTWSPPPVT